MVGIDEQCFIALEVPLLVKFVVERQLTLIDSDDNYSAI